MFNPQFNTIVNNYKFKLNKNNNMAYIEISEYIKKAEKNGKFKIDEVYDREYIKEHLLSIPRGGHDNPTALTYNQWNCGMTFICPLFEKIEDTNNYKYLGLNANYSGDVIHKRRGGGQRIVGTWVNGSFEYEDENIQKFRDYKRRYCNSNVTPRMSGNTVDFMEEYDGNINAELSEFGFKLIGLYKKVDGNNQSIAFVRRTERVSLVYSMVLNDEIMYIGKTIRGYMRPLSYLSNKVMQDVNNGIITALDSEQEVQVYAKTDGLVIEKDNLQIDIAEGYEHSLISKYRPAWNNHIR